MRRIATSIARLVGTVAAGAAIVVSAAIGAGKVEQPAVTLASISSTWQVGDFPGVRLFGAFENTIESAIRGEADVAGPLALVEERTPVWARPQPLPRALIGEASGAPGRIYLEQNYPNPFNPSTMIRYGVPSGMRVKLSIHTLLGSQIRVLVDQWQDAGTYTFDFVAADLPSGAYFYRLQTEMGTITRRMIVSK